MYLPFLKLPRQPNLANFEGFRKMIAHLYTLLSRLTSGKTYLDISSVQSCVTPILIEGAISIGSTNSLTSPDQVANHPRPVTVSSFSSLRVITTSTPHTFVVGMPVNYQNIIYWISDVSSDTAFTVTEFYGGNSSTTFTPPSTGDLISFAYPLHQLNEAYLTPRNTTYTSGTGSLAYGSIGTDVTNNSRKSNLYFNNGNGYKQVKLGLDTGNGYYNSGKTYAQTHTGWCHGQGHYKIITSTNQIKILFDYIQCREILSEVRSIVPGLRTSNGADYNILITNSGVGLNSVDSGVITANTGYYVYFLYNPITDTYGAILSLNSDRPDPFPIDSTTATYYNSYQRIGWIQTDAAGTFKLSLQINDRFNYFTNPVTAASLAFLGGGTSSSIPIITSNYSSSSTYPLSTFIDKAEILVSLVGTGINNTNQRILSLDNIPYTNLEISRYIPNYGFSGTNLDFTIAHPQDTGGTDFTSITIAFTGFKFKKEELNI